MLYPVLCFWAFSPGFNLYFFGFELIEHYILIMYMSLMGLRILDTFFITANNCIAAIAILTIIPPYNNTRNNLIESQSI